MICKHYTRTKLEKIAEYYLDKFDPELLLKPKRIDVYAVIEKLLGVPYDWKYLTPDQSVLGLTAFDSGYTYVWDEPYLTESSRPRRYFMTKGTIVIDATLTTKGNEGRENFTVMHEVFHQLIHKYFFENGHVNYLHESRGEMISGKKLKTDLDFIEYQANVCAAAFLMPRNVVTQVFKSIYPDGILDLAKGYTYIVATMANLFNVSITAMEIRLKYLKLAK